MIIEKSGRHGLERRRATYSECERFRYSLEIVFGDDLFVGHSPKLMAYIGLNPSTATEMADDPTVLRCKKRAEALGYKGMTMLNLYGFRATDPEVLKHEGYPEGMDNERTIRSVCQDAGMVVLCYGNGGTPERVKRLQKTLEGIQCHALQVLQNGRPKHPLYCRNDQMPQPYYFGESRGSLEDVAGGDQGGDHEPGPLVRQGSLFQGDQQG